MAPAVSPSEPAPGPDLPDVLVVDDEPLVLTAIDHFLEERAIAICASSPEVALTAIGRCAFSHVLADEVMPRVRGRVLLRQVARRAPEARRVLMSASRPAWVDDALASGELHAFLRKPFEPDALLAALGLG